MGWTGSIQLPPQPGTGKKLIEAAVGAAHGKPPPIELQTAWQCRRWGALPDSGGINDQDYRMIQGMTTAINIYETVSYVTNLKGNDIHRLNNSQRRILRWLMEQGINVLHG